MKDYEEMRERIIYEVLEYFLELGINEDKAIIKMQNEKEKDDERFNKIINSLNDEDSEFINNYKLRMLELETEKMRYLFEKVLKLGILITKNPYKVLFGNKKTHDENKRLFL